ncbi:hypothetical protein NPIL_135221 [Nephila pilipes]|uniref:Uncharacterized protein n=1 Tax=Nephila pilipes TaxID=299642 RepID=A0A8X6ICY4_NEPPI|nr:hypothetical protein NPIL_135221 [Nephila pilipes]
MLARFSWNEENVHRKAFDVHQPHRVRGERRTPKEMKELPLRVVAGSDTKWKVSIERSKRPRLRCHQPHSERREKNSERNEGILSEGGCRARKGEAIIHTAGMDEKTSSRWDTFIFLQVLARSKRPRLRCPPTQGVTRVGRTGPSSTQAGWTEDLQVDGHFYFYRSNAARPKGPSSTKLGWTRRPPRWGHFYFYMLARSHGMRKMFIERVNRPRFDVHQPQGEGRENSKEMKEFSEGGWFQQSGKCPSKGVSLATGPSHKLGWTRRPPRVTRHNDHHPQAGMDEKTSKRNRPSMSTNHTGVNDLGLRSTTTSERGEKNSERNEGISEVVSGSDTKWKVSIERSNGPSRRIHHPHKLGWTRRPPSRWDTFIFTGITRPRPNGSIIHTSWDGREDLQERPDLRCPPTTQCEREELERNEGISSGCSGVTRPRPNGSIIHSWDGRRPQVDGTLLFLQVLARFSWNEENVHQGRT